MTTNGPFYLSKEVNGKMVYIPIKQRHVSFGKSQPVKLVQYPSSYFSIHYDGVELFYHRDKPIQPFKQNPIRTHSFLGGYAQYQGETYPYIVKDEIEVTFDGKTQQLIQPPRSLTGFSYNQTFHYPQELVDLMSKHNVKTTITDKIKRPLNYEAFTKGLYYPTTMSAVKHSFSDIQTNEYPRVVELKDTPFAVVDLEPGFTKEDITWFYQYPMLYMEDTPNGGKHVLVYCNDEATKYQVTPKCEIIVNTMVTLYGINAKWIGNEQVVSFPFEAIVHKTIDVQKVDIDEEWLQEEVERLNKTVPKKSHMWLTAWYNNPDLDGDDLSESRLDFTALSKVWKRIHTQIYENKEWVLAYYTKQFIPYREKHDSLRQGLPYLVYLAKVIVDSHIERNS